MRFDLDHIHVRTDDPWTTAEWWVRAFNFTIVSDSIRPWGGRSVVCRSENGLDVRFSDFGGPRLPPIAAGQINGDRLEHIGFHCADIDAVAGRLTALGAESVSAPSGDPNVPGRYYFFRAPGNVIVELNPIPT
jgi:catechol 2,3-dioxygenase-like lactoylglutathione lyase family enzyme